MKAPPPPHPTRSLGAQLILAYGEGKVGASAADLQSEDPPGRPWTVVRHRQWQGGNCACAFFPGLMPAPHMLSAHTSFTNRGVALSHVSRRVALLNSGLAIIAMVRTKCTVLASTHCTSAHTPSWFALRSTTFVGNHTFKHAVPSPLAHHGTYCDVSSMLNTW